MYLKRREREGKRGEVAHFQTQKRPLTSNSNTRVHDLECTVHIWDKHTAYLYIVFLRNPKYPKSKMRNPKSKWVPMFFFKNALDNQRYGLPFFASPKLVVTARRRTSKRCCCRRCRCGRVVVVLVLLLLLLLLSFLFLLPFLCLLLVLLILLPILATYQLRFRFAICAPLPKTLGLQDVGLWYTYTLHNLDSLEHEFILQVAESGRYIHLQQPETYKDHCSRYMWSVYPGGVHLGMRTSVLQRSSRYTRESVWRSNRLNKSKGLVSDHRIMPCTTSDAKNGNLGQNPMVSPTKIKPFPPKNWGIPNFAKSPWGWI